jgi:hypothetical protein
MQGADFRKTFDTLPGGSGKRQQAEEALRASEQRLQDILDNTTAVVFVKDLELRGAKMGVSLPNTPLKRIAKCWENLSAEHSVAHRTTLFLCFSRLQETVRWI